MNIGKLGVWAILDSLSAAETAALAGRLEAWGYGALWFAEGFGRNAFVASAWLLANTGRLTVATGIANIYLRNSLAAMSAQYALAEQSEGRFLLGLGVSHRLVIEDMRGYRYEKPVPLMKAYLEKMARATYGAPPPADKPKTVIAALGPKMLELAATFADGAHPYNVTPDHTAQARAILGPGKLLCPEQKVILEKDPETARAIARRTFAMPLRLANYRNSFRRMGFAEEDLDNGGSNRLIDALVAWGDETAIRARIQQHWDAGADHVCIQSLPREGDILSTEDEKVFELLAPG